MKISGLFIVLLGLFIAQSSCSKDEEGFDFTNDYLPLETGNYWQLDSMPLKEVVGTKTINNKTYYLLRTAEDTMYYRIENDKVFELSDINPGEFLKFDLSAKVNEAWNYNVCEVTLLSKTDVVKINNQRTTNCYNFYFNIPGMYDEEHCIWLAPGIGFIQEQCGFCSYPNKKLKKAKIGGREINY